MFTQEVASQICTRLAAGETLRAICRTPGMPAAPTVCLWVTQHKEFAEQYARSRNIGLDLLADELMEIADDSSSDTISTEKGDFENKEWVNRSKLRVDARKWYLSKMAPKRYGDRLELAGDKDSPLQIVVRDLADER